MTVHEKMLAIRSTTRTAKASGPLLCTMSSRALELAGGGRLPRRAWRRLERRAKQAREESA